MHEMMHIDTYSIERKETFSFFIKRPMPMLYGNLIEFSVFKLPGSEFLWVI